MTNELIEKNSSPRFLKDSGKYRRKHVFRLSQMPAALLAFSFVLISSTSAALAYQSGTQGVQPAPTVEPSPAPLPKVIGLKVLELNYERDDVAKFKIEITGLHFPKALNYRIKSVNLKGPLDGNSPEWVCSRSWDETGIIVTGEVRVPAEINRIEVTFVSDKEEAEKTDQLPHAESTDFDLTISKAPEQAAKSLNTFQIKTEVVRSAAYPNLFTIFATKAEGDGAFASDPNKMRVELIPADASIVSIRPGGNQNQLAIDVVGPANLDVKDLIVTVYDTTDLATRKPLAVGVPFTAPVDPNQPVITNIETLFLQRGSGVGRIHIEGKGFGNYGTLPESEKTACQWLSKWSNVEASCPDPLPGRAVAEDPRNEADRNMALIEAARKIKVNLIPQNPALRIDDTEIVYADDKLIDVMFRFTHHQDRSDPFRLARAVVTIDKPGTKTLQTYTSQGLDADVSVSQTAQVLRAGAVVRSSTPTEALQQVAGPRLQAVVKASETYIASEDIGPKRDANLQYRYMVYDTDSVHRLFGKGIADNFYAIQLSVINNSPKKVSIPLASIQAEVQWCFTDRGEDKPAKSGHSDQAKSGPAERDICRSNGRRFLEGPPTLSPVELGAVSGIFGAYEKRSDPRAIVFNTLKAVATFGGALIPLAGPSLRDAQIFWTSGFTPAVGQVWIDLSNQQLQNLTTMTWQDSESIPALGGSINKFIFIPRSGQVYGPGGGLESVSREVFGRKGKVETAKVISDILGVQVIGYEVVESEAKTATSAK